MLLLILQPGKSYAKYFLLIQWQEVEKTYSVVDNSMIIDESLRYLGKELIGRVIDV